MAERYFTAKTVLPEFNGYGANLNTDNKKNITKSSRRSVSTRLDRAKAETTKNNSDVCTCVKLKATSLRSAIRLVLENSNKKETNRLLKRMLDLIKDIEESF